MHRLNKGALIICRVLAVFNWIAMAASLLGLIAVWTGITAEQLPLLHNLGVTVGGMNLSLNPAENHILPGTQAIVFIGGAALSLARALMFHGVSAVLLTARETGTPFLPSVVKHLQQVGVLSIAQPLIVLVVGLLTANHLRTELDFTSVVIGLMVLCLSQYFSQGVRLQQDVDGMV